MESKLEQIKRLHLILDEGETLWLKKLMQHPFCGVSQEKEGYIDKDMRHKFWVALSG